MKKNGFIAMSLIYTFFIVFIVVILSILNFYLDNNAIMEKVNKEILIRYNEGLTGKTVLGLFSKGIIKKGDYISYNVVNENYSSGMWRVLKSDGNNVYLVSDFIVKMVPANQYTLNEIRASYASSFTGASVAGESIELLNASDLWPSFRQSLIAQTNPEHSMWNTGSQYFVVDGAATKVVAPNCSCSGSYNSVYNTSYFANDIPQFNTLNDWYNGHCRNYTTANYQSSMVGNCPVRFLNNSLNVEKPNHIAGIRLVVKLKSTARLNGGFGNIGTPYQVDGGI